MLSIPRVQPALSHDCGNFELDAKIVLGGDIGSIETLANRVKQGLCEINVAVSPNALSVRHVDPVIILFILSIHTDIGKEGKRLENMAFLSQSRAVRMSSILLDINQYARKIVEETHFDETDISRPAQNLGNDLMNLETGPSLAYEGDEWETTQCSTPPHASSKNEASQYSRKESAKRASCKSQLIFRKYRSINPSAFSASARDPVTSSESLWNNSTQSDR